MDKQYTCIFSFQQWINYFYFLLSYSLLAHPGFESALVSGWQEFFFLCLFDFPEMLILQFLNSMKLNLVKYKNEFFRKY